MVGIDGSRASSDALWWAAGEARRLTGQIVAIRQPCSRRRVGLGLGTGDPSGRGFHSPG